MIVAGHLCLDITPAIPDTGATTFSDLIAPGKLLTVGACTISTGGAVSNTGIPLSILGQNVGLMGKVGTDSFGDILYRKMENMGLEKSIIQVNGEATSYTVVLAPPGIDRVFLHHPSTNDTYVSTDIPFESLSNTRLFHLGYPPLMRGLYLNGGAETVTILKRAKELGATTSLDAALPDVHGESGTVHWRQFLENVLPHVDIFLPSIEEACFFLDRERYIEKRRQSAEQKIDPVALFTPAEYTKFSAELLGMGAGMAALKAGHAGLYIRSADSVRFDTFGRAKVADSTNWANRELWAPCYMVPRVVSATGAGDNTIAGFLASFLRGEPIEEALQFATAAGAQNVVVPDAVSGIRPLEETRRMMTSWKKAELTIEDAGWTHNATQKLWHGPNDRVL